MAAHKSLRMKNGKRYRSRLKGGWYYVRQPGWLGNNAIGHARSLADAIAIADLHAGSTVTSIT
jgi:hypothetical protein